MFQGGAQQGDINLSRYSRQVILRQIGFEGQRRLRESFIVIIGCGALGTNSANLSTMMGVGRIRLIDRDYVELSNLHRQILFDEEDVEEKLPKAVALAEKLRRINSEVEVEAIVEDVDHRNVERLIEAADLVIDGTDNFETRFILNDACVKRGIPWVYGAVVATYGMVMSVIPGKSACFRCLVPTPPPPGTTPTCDIVGVLPTAASLIASLQTTEAVKILIESPPSQGLIHINLWTLEFNKFEVPRLEGCPTCSKGVFEYLEEGASRTTILCGREAVQVSPEKRVRLDLRSLAERLNVIGEATFNGYLIHFKADPYELVLFSDGRAIVRGTSDEGVARALYSRYVGL
jgi:adenylyltransferase/sulfurtransferase